MKEYLIQGLNGGQVEDCLTAYGEESMKEKTKGSWSEWFESIVIYDISEPLNPVRMV